MPENCGYRHDINAILMVQIESNSLKKTNSIIIDKWRH